MKQGQNEPTAILFGKGFNYSQDGPGNRLVYHLAGCNMHCPWCANPEGMSVCDQSPAYPRRTVSLSVMEEEILSSRPMFFDGGGVTLTGGEVTLQWEFLSALLPFLRENSIHSAIETNASHPRLPELFPVLSLLIADCKHWDSQKLASHTGIGGERIYENLRLAARSGIPTAIRIPLIHGFNDTAEDCAGFVRLLAPLVAASQDFTCEILPYHEYGKDKWKRMGHPYCVENGFVQPEQVRRLEEALRGAGIIVTHT